MSFIFPPRARVFIGATTVVVFIVFASSVYSSQKTLSFILFAAAAFRLIVLIKQIRLARGSRSPEPEDPAQS